MRFQKKSIPTPWKVIGNSLGGGGVLKAKFLEEMYENKLEFPGGGRRGGAFNKKYLPWGEYGHFLELHNKISLTLNFFP